MAIDAYNVVKGDGTPMGGEVTGDGLRIIWQNGVVKDGVQDGTQVIDVIEAAIQRLAFFQNSPFKCQENSDALIHLEEAASAMKRRTAIREARGVEGTYEK